MADMYRIAQIKKLNQLGEIVCISFDIVTDPRLVRPSMTTPIMSDAPIAIRSQKKHLVFERVCRKRPSVTEDNRLTLAPVVVINLSAVSCCKPAHHPPLSCDCRSSCSRIWNSIQK